MEDLGELPAHLVLQILGLLGDHLLGREIKDLLTGIKNYVVSLVIKIASNPQLFGQEKLFIKKLNVILVQVRKKRNQKKRGEKGNPSCPSLSFLFLFSPSRS